VGKAFILVINVFTFDGKSVHFGGKYNYVIAINSAYIADIPRVYVLKAVVGRILVLKGMEW
jgi:hypothetical protein